MSEAKDKKVRPVQPCTGVRPDQADKVHNAALARAPYNYQLLCPKAQAEAKPKSKHKTKSKAKPKPWPWPKPKPKPKSEAKLNPKSEAKPKPKPKANAVPSSPSHVSSPSHFCPRARIVVGMCTMCSQAAPKTTYICLEADNDLVWQDRPLRTR